MICFNCKKEYEGIHAYKVSYRADEWEFCGRLCLTLWVAPEIQKAITPRQWIPTPDEEARMRGEE